MSFPSQCPVCKTILEFPDGSPGPPVRCPVCNSRFKVDGRLLAHLSFMDFYDLLGVSPHADESEVKRAVRAKIIQHHPDRNPDDPHASDRLKQVIRAKEILLDPSLRRDYDSAYFARILPVWKESVHRAARPSRDAVGGARSERAVEGVDGTGFQNGGSEVILVQGGVPTNLSRPNWIQYPRVLAMWHVGGAALGAIAGLIIGASHAGFWGTVILSVLGAIIGWILTSYPGALVVLAFFALRAFVMGLLVFLVAAKAGTGVWVPEGLGAMMKISSLATLAGATVLGLWTIGSSAFQGLPAYLVHGAVLRLSAIGAWVGAASALIFHLVNAEPGSLDASVGGWWVLLMAAYLFLDVQILGRTWVFIRRRK